MELNGALSSRRCRHQEGGAGLDGRERTTDSRRKISTVTKEVIRNDGVSGLWRGVVPTVMRYVFLHPSTLITLVYELAYSELTLLLQLGLDNSSDIRNVPGVALYFYTLTSIRTELSYLPFFQTTNITTAAQNTTNTNRSALVKLTVPGNLMAGAIARTSVGFILNPITVLKARYEVGYPYSHCQSARPASRKQRDDRQERQCNEGDRKIAGETGKVLMARVARTKTIKMSLALSDHC